MKKSKVFLLFIICGLVLFAAIKLVDFNGLYGQDAHEYLRCAKELKAHFLSAEISPYFPPFYSLAGAALGFVMSINLALQLIAVISFALTLFILYLIIQRAFPQNKYTLIFLLCFGFLSPYLLRSNCCVMSDGLASLLLVLAMYCLIIFYESDEVKYFAVAVFVGMLCFLTRFASAIPLIVMFSILGITKQGLKLPKLGLIVLCIGISFTGLIFIFNKGALFQAINHPLLLEISPANFFKLSFISNDGHLSYSFPNWIFMLNPFIHPGFIFIGFPLLFFMPKNIFSVKAISFSLIPAIFYLLFLSFLPTQNTRLQTLIFPLLLIFFAPAFENAINHIKQKTPVLAIAAAVQLVLIFFAMRTIIRMNRTEKQIAVYLATLQNNYHSLYQLGNEGIVQSYDVNIQPISIYSEKLTSIKESSLLLIQPKNFEKQWHGKLPLQNFDFLNKHSSLIGLNSFADGWILYEVRRKD